jgi:minimal PKS ketosynthase (KS/KS alpha)
VTDRRVVITGIGVIAPGGNGVKGFWDLIANGRTATSGISFFDASPFRSRVAGECAVEPLAGISEDDGRRLDRAALLAMVSTAECLSDSGIDSAGLDPARMGVSIGTAVGCTMGLEKQYVAVSDAGQAWHTDHTRSAQQLYDYFVPSSIAAEVAMLVGAEGPCAMPKLVRRTDLAFHVR